MYRRFGLWWEKKSLELLPYPIGLPSAWLCVSVQHRHGQTSEDFCCDKAQSHNCFCILKQMPVTHGMLCRGHGLSRDSPFRVEWGLALHCWGRLVRRAQGNWAQLGANMAVLPVPCHSTAVPWSLPQKSPLWTAASLLRHPKLLPPLQFSFLSSLPRTLTPAWSES